MYPFFRVSGERDVRRKDDLRLGAAHTILAFTAFGSETEKEARVLGPWWSSADGRSGGGRREGDDVMTTMEGNVVVAGGWQSTA